MPAAKAVTLLKSLAFVTGVPLCHVRVVPLGKLEAVILLKSIIVAGQTFALLVALRFGATGLKAQVSTTEFSQSANKLPLAPPLPAMVKLVKGLLLDIMKTPPPPLAEEPAPAII